MHKVNSDPKDWTLSLPSSSSAREKVSSEFIDAQVALAAPRQMMAVLRDLMMGPSASDHKLDDIVALIARELRADVCSCFILRPGEMLELFSAVGLPLDVARKARIRVGEGLIGDIAANAAPMILPDMTAHPQFTPRPANGNGLYKAFCGVPILRGGRVRGVLVLQNRLPRAYGPEVVDILQTVAMVLAELIIAGGLLTRLELNSGFASGEKPNQVAGVTLGRGLALGTVVLYEPRIVMQDIIADNPKTEKQRLREAVAGMHEAIDSMLVQDRALGIGESRDILEAYQMFAKDRGWLSRIEATIEKGLSAEAAVQRVQNETRARMMQVNDAYIRERLQDLEDLSNRLLSHLIKKNKMRAPEDLPDNIILVARSMGPAALLDYDHTKLKGVILEKGSHSNHVAIVARSLGIPAVGQCGDILNFIADGDQAVVDGDHGMVYIDPSDYVIDLYTRSMEARTRRTMLYRRQAQEHSITRDGTRVQVMMNAGLISEVDFVKSSGAEGIGLYRTELSFMALQKFPLVSAQADIYERIMDKAGDKPVVFRTLDIGGDKPLPYFETPEEENPALGWRALRIGIDRPAVLRTQFRALIRGARGRNLKIMLPFVSEIAEYDRAREFLEMEKLRALQRDEPVPEKIEVGVMIEVPALLWQLDLLLESVDFVSIGTNDLMQYLYAADRGNFSIRSRYDALSPSMLNVLKMIADKCRAAGVPASVCGEMAGQPLEAMVLIALGFHILSAPAQSVEAVKMMIPTLDTRQLVPYLEQLMRSREHSLRQRLESFARDHNVNIVQAG